MGVKEQERVNGNESGRRRERSDATLRVTENRNEITLCRMSARSVRLSDSLTLIYTPSTVSPEQPYDDL